MEGRSLHRGLGACALWGCMLSGGGLPVQAEGWPEVFDPFRVLTIHLEVDPGDWNTVRFDTSLTIPRQAWMWADGETNRLLVEIKRKSDPALPSESDPQKVSLKVDINAFVAGQKWRDLTKLSLENGNGGNSVVQEGFAWAMHRLASEAGFYRYPAGNAAWVRLVVNSNYVGVYTSAEERGKQFLDNRGMYINNATWLYKYDPTPTLEAGVTTTPSPTLQHLCYVPFANTCAKPDLEVDLPQWIDMQAMLTLASIEAFTGNSDGLFTHNGKNCFALDYGPSNVLPRLYFPWDLDTGQGGSTTFNIYTGGPSGGSSSYQTNILAHPWFRQVYRHTMSDLLAGPLSLASLTNFLARAEVALAPALDSDPYSDLGSAADHFASIRQWVSNRTANVRTQLGVLAAPPVFSNACGEIAPGFVMSLGHTNAAGTLYYTLNGGDPRAAGGAAAGTAYAGPLTLTNTTHVMMRVQNGTNWSALRQHTFNVAGHAGALKVTELMYHAKPPTTNDSDDDYEFIELKNTGTSAVNLSGCAFDGITFAFKAGTTVAPGGFFLLVRNPGAFTSRYPNVAFQGVYWGGLDAGGEKIRLLTSDGGEILDFTYDDDPPWPQGPDGMGWSLVNANPAGDPDDPANWRASASVHGSPGADDPAPAYVPGVVVHEVLAHTDPPQEDAIELHNPTASPVDLGGWFLSDKLDPLDPARTSLKKYRIPSGTTVPAGGFKVFYEGDFNPAATNANALVKFALSSSGEEAWLSSADGAGNLTGYVTGFRFGASDNGVAFGRHRISTGWDHSFLGRLTLGTTNPATVAEFRTGPGASNAPPLVGPVVINEIMFHPGATGTEYVELCNVTTNDVPMGNWTLRGTARFTFPPATVLPAGTLALLVDTTSNTIQQFIASNDVPTNVAVFGGPFTLQNDGELLELQKPNDPTGLPSIVVDRVRYNDKAPWPTEADGPGPSLEKLHPALHGNDPASWRAATAHGSPGRHNVITQGIAIASGSPWRYDADGCDLGVAWRGTNYSAAGWREGPGRLGFGQPFILTRLTNSAGLTNRAVTTYFRKTFAVHDAPATLTLRASYDDGFVVWLNGSEVARASLPGGAISNATLAAAHDGGAYEQMDLSAFTGLITPGENHLAIEVHQATTNDADLVWDAELTCRPSAAPAFDLDGDGMPDAWEFLHALDWADAADGALDADGDGFRNRDEYLAGTDPRNAASLLRLAAMQLANDLALFEISSVSGRNYRLERTADLPAGAWTSLLDSVSATGAVTSVTATNAPDALPYFYRIRLQP